MVVVPHHQMSLVNPPSQSPLTLSLQRTRAFHCRQTKFSRRVHTTPHRTVEMGPTHAILKPQCHAIGVTANGSLTCSMTYSQHPWPTPLLLRPRKHIAGQRTMCSLRAQAVGSKGGVRLALRAADLVRLCPASSLMNPPCPPEQFVRGTGVHGSSTAPSTEPRITRRCGSRQSGHTHPSAHTACTTPSPPRELCAPPALGACKGGAGSCNPCSRRRAASQTRLRWMHDGCQNPIGDIVRFAP